jgi:hypothetical protein
VLKNLALLLFSLGLVLLALELAIRRELVPEPRYFESSGWWREHWLRGRPGPVPKKFVALDPDLGWIPAPDLRNLKLNSVRLNTNADSLRGAREISREPGEATRIVAIGDSFTFGQCVNDDQSFPAQLERLLPGSEVLNLGVMGYGHDQALQRLRVHGLAYQPDVVVLGFHRMDMPRNRLVFRDYAKPRFVLDGDGLELDGVPVPMPEQVLGSLQPRLWNYARLGLDRLFKDRYNRDELALAQAIVRQMDADARAAGAHFMLVYLPEKGDLAEPDPWPLGWLADTCVDGDIACVSPVIRIRNALRGEDVEGHFDCHYSPKVYGLVAEELAEALVERGWAPGPAAH